MTVFYRKYRPQKFSDIVGQDYIKETLLAQLTSGKISHGYLFSGPRGSGKTSTARIFAKSVNCGSFNKLKFGEPCNKCVSCRAVVDGSHLDLIEIDAASNRGIDEIRDLREKIKLSPVSSRFKVYIIDEAHMLTTEAFNALLKTLEEPPSHAIFILCTTDAGKLPKTIVSRLSRFSFQRAGNNDLVLALKKIAKSEGIKVSDEGLFAIANASDGSFRDAVSMLDQLASSSKKISEDDVKKVTLHSGWGRLLEFLENLTVRDLKSLVTFVESYDREDGDISALVKDAILLLERLLLLKIGSKDLAALELDEGQRRQLLELETKINYVETQQLMRLFLIAESEIAIYPLPKIPLILSICKYCGDIDDESAGEVVEESKKAEVEDTKERIRKQEKTEKPTDDKKSGNAQSLKPAISKKTKKKLTGSLKEVEKVWSEFLERVKPINAHLVALLRSTRPLEFDGANLTLEVFYRFHKEKLEEPKVIKILEKNLSEVFGGRINLKTELAKKESKAPKSVSKSDVVDVVGDDLSEIAAEIFSK